jgi:glycine cleavage system H protein
MNPESLKYAKTHEWVHAEGNTATIGITDFAVHALTDVVHIELPGAGKKVSVGDTFGEIESVKAVSDLYAPVAGEVAEVNAGLANDLSPLSDDPFGKGWIVKIRTSGAPDLSKLMTAAEYKKFCESEAH